MYVSNQLLDLLEIEEYNTEGCWDNYYHILTQDIEDIDEIEDQD